jgi:glycosyltransferase involved in cell wall biosynthesis
MKITIITVCWNSAKTIADTVKSVDEQTYHDIEHIIIDGKSTDNTVEIVKSVGGRVTSIVSEEDDGLYDAMNKGIAKATGDIIGILNSDDVYADKSVVAQVVSAFELHDVDAVYGDISFVREDDVSAVVRVWRSSPYVEKSFLSGWHPPHPALFLRARCYEKFGVFSTDLAVSADFELMLRFFERFRISSVHIPCQFVLMRIGGESTAGLRSIIKGNLNVLEAFKINGFKVCAPLYVCRRMCVKLLQFIR